MSRASGRGSLSGAVRGRLGYAAILSIVLLLGAAAICWFGGQKAGFHEDEVYSFWSSNRSVGIAWPDEGWMDAERLLDECRVLPGEGFRYGLVHTVQSWDVHPPLYYDLLHTVCSLFPGVFSKWLGIGLNLAAYCLCFLLLLAICRELGMARGRRALYLLFWALHPMTVSAAMFLRMYFWLTVFVLACLLLHLRLLRGWTKRRMAGIMAVSCLGFLTHYYYIIFFFFTGCAVSLLWFLQRTPDTAATELDQRLRRISRYVLFCGLSIGAAVAVYPYALSHILRGYRGREATRAFFDISGWGRRLAFFGGLVNADLFAGLLPGLLLLLLFHLLGRSRGTRRFALPVRRLLVLVPAIGYFLAVSATALLLGLTSNRYLMPVYPLLLLSAFLACEGISADLRQSAWPRKTPRRLVRILRRGLPLLFAVLFLYIDLSGLAGARRVLFLYPENRAVLEELRGAREIPAVVIYNPETPENIWRLYDKLICLPRAYYKNATTEDGAAEPVLSEAPELFVFAADTPDNIDRDARIASLLKGSPSLSRKEVLGRWDMWTWYRLTGE